MSKENKQVLNGGADALAKAIRQVFQRNHEASKADFDEAMEGLENRLSGRMDTWIHGFMDTMNKTTNENMQLQFAEQESRLVKLWKS